MKSLTPYVVIILYLELITAQTTFTGPSGGLWTDASNWSNGLPANEEAILTTSGGVINGVTELIGNQAIHTLVSQGDWELNLATGETRLRIRSSAPVAGGNIIELAANTNLIINADISVTNNNDVAVFTTSGVNSHLTINGDLATESNSQNIDYTLGNGDLGSSFTISGAIQSRVDINIVANSIINAARIEGRGGSTANGQLSELINLGTGSILTISDSVDLRNGGEIDFGAGSQLASNGSITIDADLTGATALNVGGPVGSNISITGDVEATSSGTWLLDATNTATDSISVDGSLDLSNITLDLSGVTFDDENLTYTLISATDGITGSFDSIIASSIYQVTVGPNSVTIMIPEASTGGVILISCLPWLLYRKRCR